MRRCTGVEEPWQHWLQVDSSSIKGRQQRLGVEGSRRGGAWHRNNHSRKRLSTSRGVHGLIGLKTRTRAKNPNARGTGRHGPFLYHLGPWIEVGPHGMVADVNIFPFLYLITL